LQCVWSRFLLMLLRFFSLLRSDPLKREKCNELSPPGEFKENNYKDSPSSSSLNGKDEKEEKSAENESREDSRDLSEQLMSKASSDIGFLRADATDDDEVHSQLMEQLSSSQSPGQLRSSPPVPREANDALFRKDSGDILQQAMQSEGVSPDSPVALAKAMKNAALLNDPDDPDLMPKDIVPDPSLLTLNANCCDLQDKGATKGTQKRRSRRKATRVSRRPPLSLNGTMLSPASSVPAAYASANHEQYLQTFAMTTDSSRSLPNITETFRKESSGFSSTNPSSAPGTPTTSFPAMSGVAPHPDHGPYVKPHSSELPPTFYATSTQYSETETNGSGAATLYQKAPSASAEMNAHQQQHLSRAPLASTTFTPSPRPAAPQQLRGPPAHVYLPQTPPAVPIPAPRPPSPYVLLGPGQELPEGYVQVPPPPNLPPPHHLLLNQESGLRPPYSVSLPSTPQAVSSQRPAGATFCVPAHSAPQAANTSLHEGAHPTTTTMTTTAASWQPHPNHPGLPSMPAAATTMPPFALSPPLPGDVPRQPVVMMSPNGLYPYPTPPYTHFYQLPNGQVMPHPGLVMPIQKPPSSSAEAKKSDADHVAQGNAPQSHDKLTAVPVKQETHALHKAPVEANSGRSSPQSAPSTPVRPPPGNPLAPISIATTASQQIAYPPVASVHPLQVPPNRSADSTHRPKTPTSVPLHYLPVNQSGVSQAPMVQPIPPQPVSVAQVPPQNYAPYTQIHGTTSPALVHHYAVAISSSGRSTAPTQMATKSCMPPSSTPVVASHAFHPGVHLPSVSLHSSQSALVAAKPLDANTNLASEAGIPVGHIPPTQPVFRPSLSAINACDLQSPDSGYADSLTSPADHRMLVGVGVSPHHAINNCLCFSFGF
jgi:hypothetical protein